MRTLTALQRPRRAGLTMIELTISLLVFCVITVVSTSLLISLTGFYTGSLFRANLMQSAKVVLERLGDDLVSAKVISVASGANPSLTFVVPLQLNNGTSVDFIDANGLVNWGAMEATGPMLDTPTTPHRVTITVVPDGTISESTVGVDINGDGDLADSYRSGSIRYQTSGGQDLAITFNRLLVSTAAGAAFDMDGDGIPDPIFQIAGEPFIDLNGNGIWDTGETFTDLNENGVWDGVLILNLLAFDTDRQGRGARFLYRSSYRLLNN